MRYSDLIFDIDGTLWDSTGVVADAWNQAAKDTLSFDPKLTGTRLKQEFGKTMDVIAEHIFPQFSKEEQLKFIEVCYVYEDRFLEDCEKDLTYTGVKETMKKLAEDHHLYIVSNCQKGYIELCMRKNGLDPYITDHLCYGDTGLQKWDTIRMLMEKNQISPEKALYIGDTMGDYEASVKSGIAFLHVKYGFGQVPEAAYSVSDFRELPDHPCIR